VPVMPVELARLDPQTATEGDLRDYFELSVAAFEVDRPDADPQDYDQVVGRLRNPLPGLGPQQVWVARLDGRARGVAIVFMPEDENVEMAFVDVRMHPDFRRRGIGTRLLAHLLPELAAAGRTIAAASGVTAAGDGDRWASALGFVEVQRLLLQVLRLDQVDTARWMVAEPTGYRLGRWVNAVPEDLIGSYVAARAAMEDQPMGESPYRLPEWTSERIRADEAELTRRGIEQRVVAALAEDGAVVGLTVVQIHPSQRDSAFQQDTAVLHSHRGHGLGVLMKAAMARWLRAERSEILNVSTSVDARNEHMIRVNEHIGYTTAREMIEFDGDIDALRKRLVAHEGGPASK
jgi:mycothiol synthase